MHLAAVAVPGIKLSLLGEQKIQSGHKNYVWHRGSIGIIIQILHDLNFWVRRAPRGPRGAATV